VELSFSVFLLFGGLFDFVSFDVRRRKSKRGTAGSGIKKTKKGI